MKLTFCAGLACALVLAALPVAALDDAAQAGEQAGEQATLVIDGHTFAGWEAYFASDYFRTARAPTRV